MAIIYPTIRGAILLDIFALITLSVSLSFVCANLERSLAYANAFFAIVGVLSLAALAAYAALVFAILGVRVLAAFCTAFFVPASTALSVAVETNPKLVGEVVADNRAVACAAIHPSNPVSEGFSAHFPAILERHFPVAEDNAVSMSLLPIVTLSPSDETMPRKSFCPHTTVLCVAIMENSGNRPS